METPAFQGYSHCGRAQTRPRCLVSRLSSLGLPERSLAFGGRRAALAAIGPKAGTGRDQIAGLQRRIIVNIERRETECVFSVAGAVGYQVFTVLDKGVIEI
jgi:hypothetical protein